MCLLHLVLNGGVAGFRMLLKLKGHLSSRFPNSANRFEPPAESWADEQKWSGIAPTRNVAATFLIPEAISIPGVDVSFS